VTAEQIVLIPIEPIRYTSVRYRCPFCTRNRSRKQTIADHAERCWSNPANRTCRTCAHFEPSHDACECKPGCNWGNNGQPNPDSCGEGLDLPDNAPNVQCPSWEPTKENEQ
jgi:hypothetical protein